MRYLMGKHNPAFQKVSTYVKEVIISLKAVAEVVWFKGLVLLHKQMPIDFQAVWAHDVLELLLSQLMPLSVGGSWLQQVSSQLHPCTVCGCGCASQLVWKWRGLSGAWARSRHEMAVQVIWLNLGLVPPHTQISVCWTLLHHERSNSVSGLLCVTDCISSKSMEELGRGRRY